VGTTLYEWDAFARLDRWIDVLPAVMREHPDFPSAEVEARVASTMHGALLFRQPGHPEIGAWAARAFALADRITDVNRRMLTGFLLTTYHLWIGDVAKATLVMDTIEPLARSPEASPLAQVTLWTVEAYRAWHQGRAAACLEAVARGLRISHETGVSLWDAQLLSQGIHGALIEGDVARARDFLDRMRAGLARTRVLDAAHYHRLAGWLALLQGDVPASVEHGERSLAMAVEAGAPFSEALSHLALAHALHERREPRAVVEHLESARRIGRGMASRILEYMALLAEAHVAYDSGDEAAGLKALAPAMELGRRQGYVNTPLWRGPVMARLCQRALEAGVEVAYAQDLVRRRRLVPEEPPVTLEAWPWALRVYTLGRFAVERGGAPIRVSTKVQQRPLGLLKALIALGGRDVSEEQLAEALWPDAEGDAAHQAFAVTLHRLRQLLGSTDAVVLRGGRLGLDPAACWVDAWAFERLLVQAEAAEREGRGARARALTEHALALYRGPFLGGDAGAAWAVPLRERCRRRFLRRVTRLAQALEAAGEWPAAIDAYERGLEADELAEELYQGLMGCYAKTGRRADGRAVYERCRRVLGATLGVTPSPETEALLRTLRV
jgi:DNA-binding SARP family transcriptional activator